MAGIIVHFPATEFSQRCVTSALQVVRVGEPAAIRDSLQQYSLDAKIQNADGFEHVRVYHAVVWHPDMRAMRLALQVWWLLHVPIRITSCCTAQHTPNNHVRL